VSCKTCLSLSGDLGNHGETMRNFLFLKSEFCGSLWTDSECVTETVAKGVVSVQVAYLRYMCEVQTLNQPAVARNSLDPNAGCGSLDDTGDYCSQLQYALSR
jgi:hypothetical protein